MEVLAMGKYGIYVWSCYGLTLLVVLNCAVQAKRRHRRVLQDIRRRALIRENQE